MLTTAVFELVQQFCHAIEIGNVASAFSQARIYSGASGAPYSFQKNLKSC